MKNVNLIKKTGLFIGYFSVITTLLISCGGSSDDGTPEESLSNLTLEAVIVGADAANPYGNGSGVVTFNFAATNAKLYKINFGDGESFETTNNTLSHTYAGIGITNFTVYVSAYNNEKFITTSKTISVNINTNLVWADEFDGTGAINTTKWTHEIGTGSNGWGNGEKQYYTNRLENARVENGKLIITAKKESYLGSNYTSARLISKGKYEFTYGRIDIRAKLPQGEGTWPALWLLGANIDAVGWPACGEIDIMEHWGFNPGKISSAVHTPACHGGCGAVSIGTTTVSDYSTAFHVYSLEWTKDELRFLIDDVYKYSYKPATKNDSNWPFNKPQFIILNVAMGSSYHSIDPNFVSSSMEVDYVRVYR